MPHVDYMELNHVDVPPTVTAKNFSNSFFADTFWLFWHVGSGGSMTSLVIDGDTVATNEQGEGYTYIIQDNGPVSVDAKFEADAGMEPDGNPLIDQEGKNIYILMRFRPVDP